jgi:hypothetical protein
MEASALAYAILLPCKEDQLTVDFSIRFGARKGTRIENVRLLRLIFTILNSLRGEKQIRLIAFDRAHR